MVCTTAVASSRYPHPPPSHTPARTPRLLLPDCMLRRRIAIRRHTLERICHCCHQPTYLDSSTRLPPPPPSHPLPSAFHTIPSCNAVADVTVLSAKYWMVPGQSRTSRWSGWRRRLRGKWAPHPRTMEIAFLATPAEERARGGMARPAASLMRLLLLPADRAPETLALLLRLRLRLPCHILRRLRVKKMVESALRTGQRTGGEVPGSLQRTAPMLLGRAVRALAPGDSALICH